MTAILSFSDWIARFTDAEYALLRHRMRGVQFMGPNIMRRWDVATAVNYVDLDDPIVPQFKQQLVDQGILLQSRADVIFDATGSSTAPPTDLTDAPSDGIFYARQNGAWAQVGVKATDTYFGAGALASETSGWGNSVLGYGALQYNTSGNSNTAFGALSLQYNISGNQNTAIGFYSLYNNTTANGNVAVGYNALYANTTGPYGTAVGYSAIYSVTTGEHNVGIGHSAGGAIVDGYMNVAIGGSTLGNPSGYFNLALGHAAMQNHSAGNNNTALGVLALSDGTSSNNTVIGYNSGAGLGSGGSNTVVGANLNFTAPVSNAIVIGDGDGNVRLDYGKTSPNAWTFGGFLKWGGTARAAADFSVASNVALANVPGMSVNLLSGKTYAIEAELSFTDAAAGGVKAAIGGSCTATSIVYDGWVIDAAAGGIKGNAQGAALGAAVANTTTTGTAGHITIKGSITVNVPGTLTIQFAQNTSNATASVVKQGSYLVVHDIT
jgi:hypothetical protein